MIGDKAKRAIIEREIPSTKSVRATLVFKKNDYDFDFLSTNGLYYVTQKLSIDEKSKKEKYVIRSDVFVRDRHRVSSWNRFMQTVHETNGVEKFLMDFTNLSKEIFDIASENPGTPIPFCLDMVKYKKYYEKNHPGESTAKMLWEEYEK